MKTDERRTARRETITNIVNQGAPNSNWRVGIGERATYNPTKEKNNWQHYGN